MTSLDRMSTKVRQFLCDDTGATAVEYALIAAIMGVGIISSMQTFGTALDTSITASGDAVTGVQ